MCDGGWIGKLRGLGMDVYLFSHQNIALEPHHRVQCAKAESSDGLQCLYKGLAKANALNVAPADSASGALGRRLLALLAGLNRALFMSADSFSLINS